MENRIVFGVRSKGTTKAYKIYESLSGLKSGVPPRHRDDQIEVVEYELVEKKVYSSVEINNVHPNKR